MDWYELTQKRIKRSNQAALEKLDTIDKAVKAGTAITKTIETAVENKEAQEELEEFASTEDFIYDPKSDRYYSTTGTGENFQIAELTTPQMKLHKDLSEAHGPGALKDEVFLKDDTGNITGVNEKYIASLTQKDINRLQTIDPWAGKQSNFVSNKAKELWEGYVSIESFNDESIVDKFVEDQSFKGNRNVIDAQFFKDGKYTLQGNVPKGTYIDRSSTDGDNYIEYFTINGTTRPVLVNKQEYYLLNSGRYNRDEVEEIIKNATKADAESKNEEWPRIDIETGLPKFDPMAATAIIGTILAVAGFMSGAHAKADKYDQQRIAAKQGIKGIRGELATMQMHQKADTTSMIDKYNRSVRNLTKQFEDTTGEFAGQLEGTFKASRGLASSKTTGLKENALRSLTDAFGTKAGDLSMDFDQNYDKYMRNFQKEHDSKQMQLKDLVAQYRFAKKRDSFWDNII